MPTNYLEQINLCIKERWLSTVKGNFMEEFEKEAAGLFGHHYGVATCNGTSALFLALYCVSKESSRKQVIIPAYGFHVSISLICDLGLEPVFCDVDQDTYTLDIDQCTKLINKDTLAILALQPWGNLINLDKLEKLKKEFPRVYLISDSSHAHESTWKGKKTGEYFDIIGASFGLGKLISGGELGVFTTDNPHFRDRALVYSHSNRVPGDLITEEFKEIDNNVGIKFRPHLFALLLALDDLKNNQTKRNQIKSNIIQFQKNINSNTDKVCFQNSFPQADRVFYMPVVEIKIETEMDDLIKKLTEEGFHVQKHNYKYPLNQNTIFTKYYNRYNDLSFPITENIVHKNIIQFHATDFLEEVRVEQLKNILLEKISLKYSKVSLS